MRQLAGLLAIASSLVYVAFAIGGDRAGLVDAFSSISAWSLAAATATFVPMYFAQAKYHAMTLSAMSEGKGRSSASPIDMADYLQSQIVRYLPGKVWGLIYQAERMRGRHTTSRVLSANLWQLIATNAMSAGISLALILGGTGQLPVFASLLIVLASIVATEMLHRPCISSALLRTALKPFGRFGVAHTLSPPLTMQNRGTILLLCEWIFFAAGMWILLSDVVDLATAIAGIGWYAGSTMLGMFAIVVPAGIGVREALFTGASALMDAPSTALLVVATQARLAMLAAELISCALTTIIAKR